VIMMLLWVAICLIYDRNFNRVEEFHRKLFCISSIIIVSTCLKNLVNTEFPLVIVMVASYHLFQLV